MRLSGPQLEEKKAQEARIREAEEAATQEEDPAKRAALEADVAARRAELVDLLAGFEKLTLEAARTGAAPRVSTLRKATQESAEGAAPAGGAPPTTQGGRYHPTQGYHMGRHQAPASEDAVPPSRGFPNGQYGSRGSGYVPRPQGFPTTSSRAGTTTSTRATTRAKRGAPLPGVCAVGMRLVFLHEKWLGLIAHL